MIEDIKDRKDIEQLVNRFYKQVQADDVLAPVFSHVDWPKHLPVMYDFWSSMMFGEQTYRGNPFQKHVQLPIGRQHFTQWLRLFIKTVDENFSGPKSEEIKERARSIAGIFQHKMNIPTG